MAIRSALFIFLYLIKDFFGTLNSEIMNNKLSFRTLSVANLLSSLVQLIPPNEILTESCNP